MSLNRSLNQWPIFSTLMTRWWNRTIQRQKECIFLWLWIVQFHQKPINVKKMGQPIQGPGPPIQGHIQRYFGLSCIRRVYFLCKYTEFHDMRKDCQRIKTYHSFMNIPIIYHKFSAIAQLLAPRSLKNFSPIAPQFPPCLLKLFCKTSSLPRMIQTWTLLWIHPLLLPLPLQWTKLQKYCSLKIHQADLSASTHQKFCRLCRVQGDLLVHIPPHKVKTVQTTTFNLCLLYTYEPPYPQYENTPR